MVNVNTDLHSTSPSNFQSECKYKHSTKKHPRTSTSHWRYISPGSCEIYHKIDQLLEKNNTTGNWKQTFAKICLKVFNEDLKFRVFLGFQLRLPRLYELNWESRSSVLITWSNSGDLYIKHFFTPRLLSFSYLLLCFYWVGTGSPV